MEDAQTLIARAKVYKILSQAYCLPDKEFQIADFISSLREATEHIKIDIKRELEELEGISGLESNPDIPSVEYTYLFRDPAGARAYPYASLYIEGEIMGSSTMDVIAQYAEAGVSVADEFKDIPDHISAELEYVYYLYMKELYALQMSDSEKGERYNKKRQYFLDEHMKRWIPAFTEYVIQNTSSPFYKNLAIITEKIILL